MTNHHIYAEDLKVGDVIEPRYGEVTWITKIDCRTTVTFVSLNDGTLREWPRKTLINLQNRHGDLIEKYPLDSLWTGVHDGAKEVVAGYTLIGINLQVALLRENYNWHFVNAAQAAANFVPWVEPPAVDPDSLEGKYPLGTTFVGVASAKIWEVTGYDHIDTEEDRALVLAEKGNPITLKIRERTALDPEKFTLLVEKTPPEATPVLDFKKDFLDN